MPFRSAKQRAFLFANHPDIAKRWTAEAGSGIVPSKKRPRRGLNAILKRKDQK